MGERFIFMALMAFAKSHVLELLQLLHDVAKNFHVCFMCEKRTYVA